MALATYQSCSFQEKRAVLRTFWTRRLDESEKINCAAREYAPFALGLVSIITVELLVIAVTLIARVNGWAWAATLATVLCAWSLIWTIMCSRAAGAHPSSTLRLPTDS